MLELCGVQQHRAHSHDEAVDMDAPVGLGSGLEQGESESPAEVDPQFENWLGEVKDGCPSRRFAAGSSSKVV